MKGTVDQRIRMRVPGILEHHLPGQVQLSGTVRLLPGGDDPELRC
jgi:hypothetical protein